MLAVSRGAMPAEGVVGDAVEASTTPLSLPTKGDKHQQHIPRDEWRRLHPKPDGEVSGKGDFGKHGGPRRSRVVLGKERSQAELEKASASNLTLWGLPSVEAYFELEDKRLEDKQKLDVFMRDSNNAPDEKHDACARHHIKWGRSTFNCDGCWLLKGTCICIELLSLEILSPQLSTNIKIVAYVHHQEYGRGNSTGALIEKCLNGEVLVAGLKSHESRLKEICDSNKGRIAVLLPRGTVEMGAILTSLRNDSIHNIEQTVSEESQPVFTFIAVDGTWNCARKMIKRIPDDVPRISIPVGAFELLSKKVPPLPGHDSLLGPVRKYDNSSHQSRSRGSKDSRITQDSFATQDNDARDENSQENNDENTKPVSRRSTFEAVVALLLSLRIVPENTAVKLLKNVKLKVNAVLRQKNMPPAYLLDTDALAERIGEARIDG